MGSVRYLVLAVLASGLAAGLTARPAAAGDIVVNSSGKSEPVKDAGTPPSAADFEKSTWEIVDDNLDGITFHIADVPQLQSRKAESIRAVYHDPAATPAELIKGRQLADRGDFAGAREALARVQSNPEALAWAKAEAAFRAADTFIDEGNAAEAEKALAGFKAAFPKSRWVTVATEHRARALMALDKIEDAKSEFSSVKKLPGVSEDVGIEADYWLIWIDMKVGMKRSDQAMVAAALKAYDGLIQKLGGKSQFEALLRRCQADRAACMVFVGKAADAKAELEKLAASTKDQRALAAIYNQLGTATWRAAPAGDKVQMRVALFHYLRVVTLYGDAQGADEDCAEAMFHAGELFRELKDQAPDWNQRARREWKDVVDRFPGSEWAKQARQALGGR